MQPVGTDCRYWLLCCPPSENVRFASKIAFLPLLKFVFRLMGFFSHMVFLLVTLHLNLMLATGHKNFNPQPDWSKAYLDLFLMFQQSVLQSFLGIILLHSLFFSVSQEECHTARVSPAALGAWLLIFSRFVWGSTCVLSTLLMRCRLWHWCQLLRERQKEALLWHHELSLCCSYSRPQ